MITDADVTNGGKRFANSIIDSVVFYIVSFGLMELAGPSLAISIFINVAWFFYYVLMEATTGKTIGKMITKTKVVNMYGEQPDFKAALIRTLCRIIPFEAFSFFGIPMCWMA